MPQDVNSEKKRIEWVDFFKGILICLVVIGHATGKFNGLIYQFHVGAFFMISGFTSKREKDNSINKILLRFYSLLLPLIVSFLILLPIVKLLANFNLYSLFFNYDFIGTKKLLSQFFLYGNNYINWLGAGWFLPVLFGISVLDEILIQFDLSKIQYFIIALLVYLFGFVLVHINFHGNNCITNVLPLVFICYGFFAAGFLFKTILNSEFLKKKIVLAIMFLTNCTILFYFKRIKPTVMDIVSYRLPTELLTMILVTNGFLLIYSFSNIFFILKSRFNNFLFNGFSKIFQYIGKNTLGILLFHFMFFKIPYVILYAFGKIPGGDIALLVPTFDTGCKYWWFISSISIIFSLVLWEILKKIPVINLIFGFRKKDIIKLIDTIPYLRKQEQEKKCSLFLSLFDKKIISCFILFVLTISVVFIKTGISTNDELQSRFWGMTGFINLFNHYKTVSIAQGRFLAIIPYCISFYLNFFSNHYFIYKTISFLVILLDVVLFAQILWIFIKDEFVSLLFCIIFLLSLIVCPDNTIPNAFVVLIGISLSFFFLSILCFINFLNKANRKSLIVSCCCLLYTLCSYEVFLTLTPLYFVCAFYYEKDKQTKLILKIKKASLHIIFPFATSIIYLILYIISSKLFPSKYEGNIISFTTLKEPLKILFHLFKVSLPGGLLLSQKYKYLSVLLNSVANQPLLSQILYYSTTSVWLILMCLTGITLKKSLSFENNNHSLSLKSYVKFILLALIFANLPSLPISISKMYQNNVGENGFLTLPVTYVSKFATTSAFTITIYFIIKKLKSHACTIFILILLLFYFGNIQLKNVIFGNELFKNYNRFTNIEKLFDTEEIKKLNGKNIHCPDLYEPRYQLAIHNGYWTSYASMIKGIAANFEKSDDFASAEAAIYYINDEYFCISFADGNFTILSLTQLPSNVILKDLDGVELCSQITNKGKDGDFFVYDAYVEDQKREIKVGNTLKSAISKYGIYADSWASSDFGMKIHSGDLGIIQIDGYFPFDYFDNKYINVFVDDNLIQKYQINSNDFSISIPVNKNDVVNLQVKSELKIITTNGDTRDLSFVLKEIIGK